ncbi:MAG: hypothetical protein ABW182_14225 [Sphingomonas sp.]
MTAEQAGTRFGRDPIICNSVFDELPASEWPVANSARDHRRSLESAIALAIEHHPHRVLVRLPAGAQSWPRRSNLAERLS